MTTEFAKNRTQKDDILVGIQRSRYFQTNDEYLCFTIARPSGTRNVIVTIGILIDNDLNQKIKFINDPQISHLEVSTTCERCGIKDCLERAIEPIVVLQKQKRTKINDTLKKILENRPPQ